MSAKTVLAIHAHPDDIEFMMGGTLALLRDAGYETHMLNVANGSCGTATESIEDIVRRRTQEARAAAETLGAVFHEPLVNDLEVFYTQELTRAVCAVVRAVAPEILLAPSPQDYMEDHVNACRLAVTAAFCRGMRNFTSIPDRDPVEGKVTVYHCLPWGLRDPLRNHVRAGQYVDITRVMPRKRASLQCHASQKTWLDESQGLDSYLEIMEEMCREMGHFCGCFEYAEGWRRHLHLGFCGEDDDPLTDALHDLTLVSRSYEATLGGE